MSDTSWSEGLLSPTEPEKAPKAKSWSDEVLTAEPTSARGIQQFPETTPVSRETAGAADIGDVAAASLARSLEDRIDYYSREMGVPRERFGLSDGDLVYQTESGGLQAVEPGILRQLMTTVGPSIPAVSGAVGGVVGTAGGGGVGSLVTGAAGGALGAAGGEAARQNLANLLGVQQAGLEDISKAAATEGAFDLGAGLAGTLVAKGVSRVVASRAAKELNRLIRQEGRQAMDALKSTLDLVNTEYGTNIRLTPAELSELPLLQGQQMALAANPETAQTMMPFYRQRAGQLQEAMPRFLSREISPSQAGADVAGEQLAQSSEEAVEAIRRQRTLRGSPAYQQAFAQAGPIDLVPAIQTLDTEMKTASRPLRVALGKVRREMGDAAGMPIKDLELIQNRVKELIDDEIGVARRAGRMKQARSLQRVQNSLLQTLDNQSDLYKQARALWGDLSGPVTAAEGGVLPTLANATPLTYAKMGQRLFGQASPAEIGRAREAVLNTKNGSDNWNAALRGFLEDRWSKAGREFKSTVGRRELGEASQPVSFWADVYGDKAQQARLKAAMDGKQWKAFRNILQVMEATGRAINWNSTTAQQLEGLQSVRTPAKVSNTLRMLSTQPLEPVARAYEEWVQGRNLQLLADVITSSDSVDELIKITSAQSPRIRAFQLLARALNLARANVMAE